MILASFGMIRISGQFSGKPGLLLNRYRQLRRAHLRKDVRRLTSRKITKSAASKTAVDTPSITHTSCLINAAIFSARQFVGLFFQPGRHTISSRPKTGKFRCLPTCFASVVFPLPAFPVMKIRVMPTDYTSNQPSAPGTKITARPARPAWRLMKLRGSPPSAPDAVQAGWIDNILPSVSMVQLVGVPPALSSTRKLFESSLRERVGNTFALSIPADVAAWLAHRSWRSAGAVSTAVLDIRSGVGSDTHPANAAASKVEQSQAPVRPLLVLNWLSIAGLTIRIPSLSSQTPL
jgi:hypothetical protein